MTEAKITGLSAAVHASWSMDIAIEPGSVPDRDQPYSSIGARYRPDRLRLTYEAAAESAIGLGMLAPHRAAGQLRRVVRHRGTVITGRRLRRDGTPGAQAVTENFYGSSRNLPGWALELAVTGLAALTAQGESSDRSEEQETAHER
jgi:hypothetical protein